MLDVTITAPADVQAEETDAWDLAQMWAEFRAELEITGEQAEKVYRNLRRVIGYAGCWNWKREPWVPPERPEKLRGLAAVRTGAGCDGAARRGAVAEMCTAF